MNTEIEKVLKKFNIIYMEIINIHNLDKCTYGTLENIPYKGLYNNLLGTEEQIRNLIETFDINNDLQTWRQGELVALVYKNESKLIGMFYCTEKKGLESYKYAQDIFVYCKEKMDKI